MGVKHLWTVLAPFCDRKPLYELQGKTVAVDLSCWICEAQNIAEYQVQPRMYLRNLYFRTCYLLLMDVNPVFVLEGKAPELKYDTIAARNAIQFKGAKPKTDKVKTGKDRTRFHFVLRQCEEMLGQMGLACIKGNGEAESLCAYLNEDGLVDGCISQDSDCFAYGAQVVYRNFSISTQGVQSASGGAVDVYDIRKANHSLDFGRNKIIAMALLIGCDYSEGVHGIGKDSVIKFLETVSNDEVLDKLRSWRNNKNLYENYEKQLADKNICTSCGHTGKVQGHTKNGCTSCNTTKGCDPFKYKNERLLIKNEVNMRNKAIQDPIFPDEILIKEFLERKDEVKQLDLTWKQPNIVKFLKFTTKFLQWEELYAFEKILPILTRWQCRNPALLKDERKLKGILKPVKIKKVRNPKGVPSYEIIWSDPGECFKGLVPENQILQNNVDLEKLWSTIEPQSLVENTYPQLVEDFKQSKIKPKKISKRRRNKNDSIDKITDKLENVSITEPKPKKSRKPKVPKGQKTNANVIKTSDEKLQTIESTQKTSEPFPDHLNTSLKQLTIDKCEKKAPKTIDSDIYDLESSFKKMIVEKQMKTFKPKTKTLDSFVKKAVKNSYKHNVTSGNDQPKYTIDGALNPVSSTPTKCTKNNLSFDLDISSFGDENDCDLSEIINDIVSRRGLKDDLKNIADKYVQCLKENVEVVCLDDSDVNALDNQGKAQNIGDDKLPYSFCALSNNKREKSNVQGYKSTKNNLKSVLCDNFEDFEDKDEENNLDSSKDKDISRTTSFFLINPGEENDLFEKTFNATFRNFGDSSGSETEEYEYDVNEVNSDNKKGGNSNKSLNKPCEKCDEHSQKKISETSVKDIVCLSSDDDSFSDNNYVPLYERLKNN